MKKKLIVAGIAFLLAALVLAGCEGDDKGVVTPTETGSVIFKVTDVPIGTFDNVYVTFSEIKLHEQLEDDNASWVTVTTAETTVDMIDLHLNNETATIGEAEIAIGNYSKLWINVTAASGVLNETGETVNITVPSNWLKIQQLHLFNISKGNHTFTIDIDLEGSIHEFHGGEEYKFIPVISQLEHTHENQLKFREHNKSKIKNMVGNRKPAVDIMINDTLVLQQINLDSNASYEFNASATLDLDDDNLTFTWDFGDGTTGNGSVVTHTYSDDQRTYQLWLTITVNDGTEESKEHIVIKINRQSGNGNGNGNGGSS